MATAVSNSGKIKADGGQIILTANAANAILSSVVNNSGIIEAKSLVDKDGKVILEGNNSGAVINTGTIDASSAQAGASGGSVDLHREYVINPGIIKADGSANADGGTILLKSEKGTLVGTDSVISANGVGENSNGGNIRILSDMTNGVSIINSGAALSAKGGITGDGGFIEVSGHSFQMAGDVALSAAGGTGGTFYWIQRISQ